MGVALHCMANAKLPCIPVLSENMNYQEIITLPRVIFIVEEGKM